jgi:hypothetical protein
MAVGASIRRNVASPLNAWLFTVPTLRPSNCLPPPERQSRIVDRSPDKDFAGVGVHGSEPIEPRPRHVDLGERGLHQALRPVPVTAQQVRGAPHHERASIHVLAEVTIPIVHAASRRSPFNTA